MKKFKLLNIILVLTVMFSMPIAYAHEVDVDKDNIKIESVDGDIYSGSKIIVNSEKLGFEDYKIYYQYVILENDAYNAYEQKIAEQGEYIKNFLDEHDLDRIEDASEAQIKEYNEAVAGYNDDIEALLPEYVEENWIETPDHTAKLDLTTVPENSLGKQPYVLWIKVEPTDDDAVYNDFVVLAKKQVADSEAGEPNAGTGDGIVWIGLSAAVLAGIMVVSYRKSNA